MKKYFKYPKNLIVFERFSLLFNRIKEIKFTNFQIIFTIYGIIFSVFLLLSIPGLFNYENKIKQIENNIAKEFKIYLENISGIKYRFIPTPHIIIKKSVLKLSKNQKNKIAELKDVKVFLSLRELYNNKNIKIKKMIINKSNFYFIDNDFLLFNQHLQKNIIKPLIINNSNFFYINKENEVATISPIKNLKYFIDFQNQEKELEVKGKLFDIDYNFYWKKNYNEPNFLENIINFRNPNISILNQIKKNKEKNILNGKSKIQFLDNKLNLNYSIKNKLFEFETEKKSERSAKTDFFGNMEFDPFYFNVNLILKKFDTISLVQNIFSYLYSINNSVHENLNGNFSIKVKNENDKLFQNLNFIFLFEEGKINVTRSSINLKKIGKIKFSNYKYVEKVDKLYLKLNSELVIADQKQFYRRFQIPKEDRINLKKIYFNIETNIDDGTFYLFDFKINSKNNEDENIEVKKSSNYEVRNIQQLTKIVRDKFKNN